MEDIRKFLEQMLTEAGGMSQKAFGNPQKVRLKSDRSNVVTDTDVAVERFMTERIGRAYPTDGLIGEESGFHGGSTDAVWIIDPLDGSSNFAAGLPWFGIMAARVVGGIPEQAGIFLPAAGEMYLTQKGKGATVNGTRIRVTEEESLSNVLVSYGIDVSEDPQKTRRETETIGLLAGHCRNLRATNSVYDFCAVATGKLGAYLNRSSKVWDNAASILLIEEAGGMYTDFTGKGIVLDVSGTGLTKNYEYIAAAPAIHRRIASLITEGK